MNQIDYDKMSDSELRAYCLSHADDKAAMAAYVDRLHHIPDELLTPEGKINHLTISQKIEIIADRLSQPLKNK